MHVLHMNTGEGETSYAKNSHLQKKIISVGSSMMESAIFNIMLEVQPKSMGVADLGCSSGPNSLTVVSKIIHTVNVVSQQIGLSVPELRVSLNDLPGNDFNDVFKSLPELYNKMKKDYGIEDCYVCGLPGSFYGSLFPAQSLHFVHSSSSLPGCLRLVPLGLKHKVGTHLNKEKLYLSKSSSTSVVKAYQKQFHEDFSLFLRSRAKEMVSKGRMVLSFMGRRSPNPCADEACYQWELLANALMSLALDGLLEKEKIDSFDAPYYAPSLEEVAREVEYDGSFVVDGAETFEIKWDDGDKSDFNISSGYRVAKTIRAVVEPMLESHFDLRPELMDELFRRYAKMIDDCLSKTKLKYINLVISFMRNE